LALNYNHSLPIYNKINVIFIFFIIHILKVKYISSSSPLPGLMIPHPPAEKKEGRPVHSHFRRRDREHSHDRSAVKGSQQKEQRDETVKRSSEERSDELNSSQRHIDGIRQYHEQKYEIRHYIIL
jgi:hypothetical protein